MLEYFELKFLDKQFKRESISVIMSVENISNSKISTKKTDLLFNDLDALIKLIIVIILATLPFFINNCIGLLLITAYLIFATIFTRIKFRTLLISATSYFIIVLFPYFFGYSVNAFLYWISGNEFFASSKNFIEIFLRLFRLFVIWYVSIIYFHTTSIDKVLGLFGIILSPLKRLRIPVDDYLKLIMCIVIDLRGKGTEIMNNFKENARKVIGGEDSSLKTKIGGAAQFIVSLIVSSFDKINEVQNTIENFNTDNLYNYKFKITLNDILAIISMVIFIILLFVFENR